MLLTSACVAATYAKHETTFWQKCNAATNNTAKTIPGLPITPTIGCLSREDPDTNLSPEFATATDIAFDMFFTRTCWAKNCDHPNKTNTEEEGDSEERNSQKFAGKRF